MRHHNRQLHKAKILKGGIRKKGQAPKQVHGFGLYDKVRYQGKECFVWGRRSSGYFLLRYLDGTKATDSVAYKKLKLLERGTGYLIERVSVPTGQADTLCRQSGRRKQEDVG